MTIKVEMLRKLKKQKCLDSPSLLEDKKELARLWFTTLRNEMCESFEEIENSQSTNKTKKKFFEKRWQRQGGGGGIISIMKGDVFEKVGVNVSTVYGTFSREFR